MSQIYLLTLFCRDLKCANLLLDADNTIKISDFGLARRFTDEEKYRTFCGSTEYAAPEILQGIDYEPTGYDIWSMGIILFEMVRHFKCFTLYRDQINRNNCIQYNTIFVFSACGGICGR